MGIWNVEETVTVLKIVIVPGNVHCYRGLHVLTRPLVLGLQSCFHLVLGWRIRLHDKPYYCQHISCHVSLGGDCELPL